MFTLDIRALDVAVVVAVLFIFYRARAAYQARKNGPLPPGPKPLPFVGNLFDIPKVSPWAGYRDLCSRYGE